VVLDPVKPLLIFSTKN